MPIYAFIDTWRTHQVRDRKGEIRPGEFECCQDVECPHDHFISGFKGSRPAENAWDGMLDSDGKVGK